MVNFLGIRADFVIVASIVQREEEEEEEEEEVVLELRRGNDFCSEFGCGNCHPQQLTFVLLAFQG